ncbi:MAG TPA: hypothetical protein VID30_01205 [Bradyrhizobium sp.]|jgi:transcriptional regulator GlxA family with amidase domain
MPSCNVFATCSPASSEAGRRRFAAGAFVEMVRLEAARTLISEEMPLKTIAAKVGLTPIRLNRAFEPQFGVAPRLFRDMHRKAA